MASLRKLREAAASALDVIPDVQVRPYIIPNPTSPAIQVVTGPRDYHRAMVDGLDVQTLQVQARVQWADSIAPQMMLDRFMESEPPDSVKAALEADRTLGGLVDDLVVVEASGVQLTVPASGGLELMVEWTVDLYGTGVA